MQPCWTCKKYAGGCSWSKAFVPVDGWDAEPTKRSMDGGPRLMESYLIKHCPEYDWDGTKIESARPGLKYDYEKFKRLFLAGMTDREIQRRMGGMPFSTIDGYRRMVRREIEGG